MGKIQKGISYLKQYGIKETLVRMNRRYVTLDKEYAIWYDKHCCTKEELENQREYKFQFSPTISILTPVYNTPLNFLKEMIDSVCAQTYQNWDLCIANASPDNQELVTILKKFQENEERIKVIDVPENLGIAQNTNAALEIASGEYIGLLDHDDLLASNALYEIVRELNKEKQIDVLYTDEDKIDSEGKTHFQPNFKPDFNIDLLRSNNYICHFFVVKKEIMLSLQGFRSEYDGAQDYDLFLRCIDQTKCIAHIPKILYHWRVHQTSTADNPASKMYAYEAGKKAIEDHLRRNHQKGLVEIGNDLGFYRIRYELNSNPIVSVIILNKDDVKSLKRTLGALGKCCYRNLEIILVGCTDRKDTERFYKQLQKRKQYKVLSWTKEYKYASIMNWAIRKSSGEYILLLDEKLKIKNIEYIQELLSNCVRKEVGLVGGKSYYKNMDIHNAGIILRKDFSLDKVFYRQPKNVVGYMHRESLQQNLSALLSENLMFSKNDFQEVGGFFENINNKEVAVIDLAMKMQETGKTIVFNPYAESIYVDNSAERKEKVDLKELEYLQKKWGHKLDDGDPAYNENLDLNYKLKI